MKYADECFETSKHDWELFTCGFGPGIFYFGFINTILVRISALRDFPREENLQIYHHIAKRNLKLHGKIKRYFITPLFAVVLTKTSRFGNQSTRFKIHVPVDKHFQVHSVTQSSLSFYKIRARQSKYMQLRLYNLT